MTSALTKHPQPAWRLLRYSVGLTLIGGVALLSIFAMPRAWSNEWYLFIVGTSVSCVAIVLALIACAVRGADSAVGSAVAIAGVNMVAILSVVVAIFNFRMGVP